MKNRILVFNNVSQEGLKLFGAGYEVGKDVVDPQVIVVRGAKVDTNQHPNLIAVARAGAGTDKITVKEATEKGVCIFNTPGANANAVAENVFVGLGAHARNLYQAHQFVQGLGELNDIEITKAVDDKKSDFTGFELAGKTLGVIGLGKIGVLVANAGINRGMKVIGYDSSLTPANMHQLDSRVKIAQSMEEVLSTVGVLSVHIPFIEGENENFIGANQIAKMKIGSILLNYARGELYNDTAVCEALDDGRISAFITDFPSKALINNPKAFCIPHVSASTNESEKNCAVMAVQQLKDYLEYGVVKNSVNFPTIEAFPSQAVRTRLVIVNKDIPNMIAVIAGVLGEHGINIPAMENKSNGKIGYNLVDLESGITDELVEKIRQLPNVINVRVLHF